MAPAKCPFTWHLHEQGPSAHLKCLNPLSLKELASPEVTWKVERSFSLGPDQTIWCSLTIRIWLKTAIKRLQLQFQCYMLQPIKSTGCVVHHCFILTLWPSNVNLNTETVVCGSVTMVGELISKSGQQNYYNTIQTSWVSRKPAGLQ